MLNFYKKDPVLWKMLLTIALPIALQNLLTSLTQMMDTIMLGELGDIPLSASAIANQPFFIFSLFIFGMAGGGAVLTAQYWGKGELLPIKTVMATIVRLVALVAAILTVVIYLFPSQLMSIFTQDTAVIEAGVGYLKYVAPTYFLFGISCIFASLFRTIEVVRLALIANSVTLVVNVGLNYVLIFGHFGAPAMGLEGAALATLIARFAELIVVLYFVFIKEKRLNFTPKCLLLKNKLLTADLRKYCTPVVTAELVWALGMSMQTALFGNIDTLAVSANTIIGVVQNLATLAMFGVANAAGVIIGKTIGEGDIRLAKRRGRSIEYFAIIIGVIGAIVILIGRDVMVDFYNVEEATKALAKDMLIVTAVVIFFTSTAAAGMVGLLRGGGDAKFTLILEMISLWVFAVPLGYLAGLVFHWPIVVVYALFKTDELVKCIMCWVRLAGDRWIHVVARDNI